MAAVHSIIVVVHSVLHPIFLRNRLGNLIIIVQNIENLIQTHKHDTHPRKKVDKSSHLATP